MIRYIHPVAFVAIVIATNAVTASLGVVTWSAWCVMVALLWRYRWEGRR